MLGKVPLPHEVCIGLGARLYFGPTLRPGDSQVPLGVMGFMGTSSPSYKSTCALLRGLRGLRSAP